MRKIPTGDRLVAIQERLIEQCRVSLEAGETWQRGRWLATISTERNEWPCWIQFVGDTPDLALDRLEGYLAGKVPDHAQNRRHPKVFLKPIERRSHVPCEVPRRDARPA